MVRDIEIIVLFITLFAVYVYLVGKFRTKIELAGHITLGLYMLITFLRVFLYLMDLS